MRCPPLMPLPAVSASAAASTLPHSSPLIVAAAAAARKNAGLPGIASARAFARPGRSQLPAFIRSKNARAFAPFSYRASTISRCWQPQSLSARVIAFPGIGHFRVIVLRWRGCVTAGVAGAGICFPLRYSALFIRHAGIANSLAFQSLAIRSDNLAAQVYSAAIIRSAGDRRVYSLSLRAFKGWELPIFHRRRHSRAALSYAK